MPTISRTQSSRKEISLRPCQRACLDNIAGAPSRGVTRQLVVQATGLGKCVQAANMLSTLNIPRGKRSLFLVHRDELAYQAVEKFRKYRDAGALHQFCIARFNAGAEEFSRGALSNRIGALFAKGREQRAVGQ